MDIHALVQSVSLTDVRTIEIQGSLKLQSRGGRLDGLGEIEPRADMDLRVNPASWGQVLETWFRVVIESEQFKIVAAVAVTYARETEDVIPEDVQTEFIERVSVMTAFPYLRALVQQMASELRLGDMTLGVLRPGGFRIQTGEAEAPATD